MLPRLLLGLVLFLLGVRCLSLLSPRLRSLLELLLIDLIQSLLGLLLILVPLLLGLRLMLILLLRGLLLKLLRLLLLQLLLLDLLLSLLGLMLLKRPKSPKTDPATCVVSTPSFVCSLISFSSNVCCINPPSPSGSTSCGTEPSRLPSPHSMALASPSSGTTALLTTGRLPLRLVVYTTALSFCFFFCDIVL